MITYDETVKLLERAVDERGTDYVYEPQNSLAPACLYFENDAPSCLVGLVGSYIGLTSEHFNEGGGTAHNQTAVLANFSDDSVMLLDLVQEYQDSGYNWGSAVAKAIEIIPPTSQDS